MFALFAFLVSFAAPTFAAGGQTGQISGTVVDVTTRAAVVGARIGLASPSGSYSATTDAEGRFTINGVSVDTYTLTIERQGYATQQSAGVTITGDQTLNLGSLTISKQLKTIGSTRARGAASAFQPNQTTDSYTISGARQQEALGKAANFDENALILSVPGASTTAAGRVTIRGGLSNEVGYQLDGVPFTEPFFSQPGGSRNGGSTNTFNGLGSLQVVEGAGDATQGNIGSGVVNIVPKRGTYPGTGLFDAELGTPGFNHQIAVDYGVATRAGNISNYLSYAGQRYSPYYGYQNQNPAISGNYFSTSERAVDDIIDNLVIKFGKNNRQSLQALYNTKNIQDFGQRGGLTGRNYYLYDPYVLNNGAFGNPFAGLLNPNDDGTAAFAQYTGKTPYALDPRQIPSAIVVLANPLQSLKFEYDNALDDKTFLAVRYYNFSAFNSSNTTVDSNANSSVSKTGGQRVGQSFELTHSFGSHTVTLQGQLENQKPIWNDYAPLESLGTLHLGVNGTQLNDFLPAAYNANATGADAGVDGWVYSHIGYTRIPVVGINYNKADFQVLGAGLRDQWAISDKIKLDYGVRVDHANYKFGSNTALNPDIGNFSDVDPSFLRKEVLQPTAIEPRIALSLQPTRNDAVRFGYGRSVEFLNAQDAGTPGGIYGGEALAGVPVTPGTNTGDPKSWTCGSGLNSARLLPNGSNASGKGGGFFRCANYLQQMYWAYDQNFDAPDIGNGTSPTYDNYDASYSHQFKSGFALRTTGFYRRASGLPSFFVLAQKNDPATGQILYQVFSVNNNAINKTTGVEFNLTTPERPVGFSGFLSATYQNAISSVPPLLPGEDALPLITTQSFQLGNTYRAGFLSPFVVSVGGTYRSKGGLKVTPTVQFDAGYPTGVGKLIAYNGFVNGQAVNVLQSNLGGSAPTAGGFNGSTGQGVATQYVDPAYPGSIIKPNIAATRGTAEGPSAGAQLTRPSALANLTVEYTIAKHSTIGVVVKNLFGNVYYGNTPQSNTYYQPVTTGVAGPATGYPLQANPAQTSYANHGFVQLPTSSFGNQANLLLPNAPTTYRLYYQLGL